MVKISMTNLKIFKIILLGFLFLNLNWICPAQTGELRKRTTYKTETAKFGAGGTISIVGAPNGSIEIEGWQRNEIEISAEIEVQAETEEDLAALANVNTYLLEIDFGHARIQSFGSYDKSYLKRFAKNFPKRLRDAPVKIDYKIKVPVYCDLEIDGGRGDLNLSNVEGTMLIQYLETNAKLDLIGGTIRANFGKGAINVRIPSNTWRGRSLEMQLVSGNINVELSQNLNAEIDAKILRSGQIENSLEMLEPREKAKFTDKIMIAKAGNGGANLSFIIGDGNLKLTETRK